MVLDEPLVGGLRLAGEFALGVLNVPEVVVCGHSHCGAVGARIRNEDLAALPAVHGWLDAQLPPPAQLASDESERHQPDVAAAGADEHRLRVLDGRGAGGAVPRMSDRHDTRRIVGAGDVRHEAHRADGVGAAPLVHGDDPERLLPPVLERVEPRWVRWTASG